jgi:hypothetical protein
VHRRKIGFIIVLVTAVLMTTGCSFSGAGKSRRSESSVGSFGTTTYGELYSGNITNNGLYIRKISAEIYLDDSRDKVTIILKKDVKGSWLVSIRSFAGIEVARLYADKNEVIVLDRLGRKATVYGWAELEKNYGIAYNLLPFLLGDLPIISGSDRRRIDCNETAILTSGNLIYNIIADCTINKVTTYSVRNSMTGREVSVLTSDFLETGDTRYPSRIELSESLGVFHVKMSIHEIDVLWDGFVEFSIPSNYTISR